MEQEKEKKYLATDKQEKSVNEEAKKIEKKDLKNKEKPTSQKIADDFLPENFNPFLRPGAKNYNNIKKDNFEERIINIKRVIKVTKGGRRFKFSALVVVGDREGNVGFAIAKHIEVPEAIKKASRLARKNLTKVKVIGKEDTISHEIIGHHGAARVLLKPTREGKGIIASDVVRSVVELAGIRNIYSKNLGTNNPQNVILATLDGLKNLRTKEEIEKLHTKEEIKSRFNIKKGKQQSNIEEEMKEDL
ncbi:/ rpsE / 30S ribosomal protein S5 /:428849 Reverse [Candidatus Hepatoplasma crinochetorum]|uniref:Small ribosomal subunit protein uS5 n=1 Tax=Candidatus Hepatoplasma crinochetorum TaxID=295596 RepID=A0A0G7ZL76_9MOLU|nr:/ rpsE / 30S ribosomal protein S5 /:428849 Reverse [Candidatus Hepatoplasma crinochetorum]